MPQRLGKISFKSMVGKCVGSPGRIRTSDQPVNSQLVYHFSYRGKCRCYGKGAYNKDKPLWKGCRPRLPLSAKMRGPRPESNRRARICSPLSSPLHHMADLREIGRRLPQAYMQQRKTHDNRKRNLAFCACCRTRIAPSVFFRRDRDDRFCHRTPSYGGWPGPHRRCHGPAYHLRHDGYSARAFRAAGRPQGLPISTSICRLATRPRVGCSSRWCSPS